MCRRSANILLWLLETLTRRKNRLPDSESSLHYEPAATSRACPRNVSGGCRLNSLRTNHNRAPTGRFQQVPSAGQPFRHRTDLLPASSVDNHHSIPSFYRHLIDLSVVKKIESVRQSQNARDGQEGLSPFWGESHKCGVAGLRKHAAMITGNHGGTLEFLRAPYQGRPEPANHGIGAFTMALRAPASSHLMQDGCGLQDAAVLRSSVRGLRPRSQAAL